MLFDFLIEIFEEKIRGQSCFIAVAARYSDKDIKPAMNQNDGDPTAALEAVVEKIKSDREEGSVDKTLFSNKIEVSYFDSNNKEAVFFATLAKAVHWLLAPSVNCGHYMAYSKIKEAASPLGRAYQGFSSFAYTPTNQSTHSIITDYINKAINSQELRQSTVQRVIGNIDDKGILVHCDVSTKETAEGTMADMLCMGLTMIPIKTQDMTQTILWFNEHYAETMGTAKLDLINEYKLKNTELKDTISMAVENSSAPRASDAINELQSIVTADEYEEILMRLAELTYICAASEAIWQQIIAKESFEAA